jgi:hypothetical protein
MNDQPTLSSLGHNSQYVSIEVEVRLFNSISKRADGVSKRADGGPPRRKLRVPVGTTVGHIARQLGIAIDEIFLVLVNGRDITPGLIGEQIKDYHMLDDGDVVAFSGAVPYSFGYGAPVV